MESGGIAFPNLGIYLSNVPKSFNVFGIEIALYGIIIGIGVVLAILFAGKHAVNNGINPDDIYDGSMFLVIFGILGARLYYVIFSFDYYKDNLLSIFNIREGGLAIYGGVIAGFITLLIFCKKKKLNPFKYADVCFPAVLIGQIVGRWGNFTNREVFGTYTNNLFAMRLPISDVRLRDIDDAIRINIPAGANYIQVHPTFLYESVYNLILFSLILLFNKKKAFDGEVILWYGAGYGIGRFIIEGIRTDRLLIGQTNIAVSQMLGAVMFIVAVVIDIVVRIRLLKRSK